MIKPAANTARDSGILGVGAHIADMRVSQGDQLAGVGRIGKNFLITGDGGVEHHFTDGMAGRANCAAGKDSPVSQGKNCGNRGHWLLLIHLILKA